MRLKILYTTTFIFCLLSLVTAPAQEQNPTSAERPQTTKIDEIGPASDCVLGARLEGVRIGLNETPDSIFYIITYRGTADLFANQTDDTVGKIWERMKRQFAFFKVDEKRVYFIDGGFRNSSTFLSEVWLVPVGGIIPAPSDTVEKPKLPKDKAYRADERWLSIDDARIKSAEDILAEAETQEEITEPQNEDSDTEIDEPQNEEVSEELIEDGQYMEEIQEYDWISEFFVSTFQAEKTAKSVLIFYADDKEFDLEKARQFIENDLREYSKKEQIDLNRIKIVFGGYRESPQIEFWIVPNKAKEPAPTPQERRKAQ